ncbi:MAG TPA: hypothetical protein PLX60_12590 [Chitinophagales bacterium]|jgi:hypothetical protein|nr:hypothetical protein [Chitinophagales bacterium]
MSQNQKEEQVVTNNQSTQHNQGNQSNQENQRKSGDTSQTPPVIHETKIPTEVPKKHSTEEHDRSHKMPVGKKEDAENEDENQQDEMDASFDDKKSNKKDVE